MNRRAQAAIRWGIGSVVVMAVIAAVAWVTLRYLQPVVTITEVVEGPVVEAFYSTGTVLPEREYPIKSNVAGTIVQMNVDKGSAVKQGQVLAVVRSDDLEFRLRQRQAELKEKQQRADDQSSPVLAEFDARIKAADEQLAIARREEQRQQELISRNAASQQDVDQASERVQTVWSVLESLRAQRAAKKLELQRESEVAQAALEIAQWDYDQQTVRSPIDGVVLDRPTSLGTRVGVNDHLMQIADVSPANLVMRAAVDEEDKTSVRMDQDVRMTLYSFHGRVFQGTVSKIYDKADPDRRTFEVDVRMDEPNPNLAAGMTGELAFVIAETPKTLVVPSQAVQKDGVWIVRDRKVAKADVRVGLKSVERAEILSGLKAGDQVLISPAQNLREGQVVRPETVDPVEAAGLNRPKVEENRFKGF